MQIRWMLGALLLAACTHLGEVQDAVALGVDEAHAASVHQARGRLVAIGDVHGDLEATRRVLRLVGAIASEDQGDAEGTGDADDHGGPLLHDTWIGGSLTIVQLGDQIDRGPHDKQVLDYFAALEVQARAAGGALILLNGNHELMNVDWDFRYVHEDTWSPFDGSNSPSDRAAPDLDEVAEAQRGRHIAFHPGGPYARMLAQRDVIAIVGDTLFVHGGVLPVIVDYGIDRLNAETRAWMRGDAERPQITRGRESPVWSRHYSHETAAEDCVLLEEVLDRLSLRRMVVAHTVQDDGVSGACSERVWRIDVGMSAHYGGPTQALEILEDGVRVLD